MCSGSEAGSYLRLTDFVYHSTLGLRVIKKKKEDPSGVATLRAAPASQRDFFIDNLLVRIHFIIVMIRWTGLAPWEFEFPFPDSLASTFIDPASHTPHLWLSRFGLNNVVHLGSSPLNNSHSTIILALPHSRRPNPLKLTCWLCGTNTSTFEQKRAQIRRNRARYPALVNTARTCLGPLWGQI